MSEPLPLLADQLAEGDIIDFGDNVPQAVNALLQQGVAAYYDDRPRADALFRQAQDLGPEQLPVYYCLYKIHTYQGNLDAALRAARDGLAEAARQANISPDWQLWDGPLPQAGAARFAAYTLKAMAFIHLRRNEAPVAKRMLAKLAEMGPDDGMGNSIVAEIAAKM